VGRSADSVNQVSLNIGGLNLADPQTPRTLEDYIVTGESNIVNLLKIPGEQQVLLKVTVAEVSRSAARSIGLNFQLFNDQGIQVFAQNTGGLTGGGGGAGGGAGLGGGIGGGGGSTGSVANLPARLDNGQVNLLVQALRTVNMAKSLAEPNLVAMNGQSATFMAGGEFPVPVVTERPRWPAGRLVRALRGRSSSRSSPTRTVSACS
jgi:pilus assembly protein CpaC